MNSSHNVPMSSPAQGRVRLLSYCSLFFLLAGLVGLPAGPVQALTPLELERQKVTQPQDPDRYARPETKGLKGPDIREHRDKVNAVKKLIFKDANVPSGAIFQTAEPPPDGDGIRYRAAASLEQFTPGVQAQIATRLSDGPPAANATVAVEMVVQGETVRVETAVLASPPAPSEKTAGARTGSRPAPLSVPTVRPAPLRRPAAPAPPAALADETVDSAPIEAPVAAETALSGARETPADRPRPSVRAIQAVTLLTGRSGATVVSDVIVPPVAAPVFLIPLRGVPPLEIREITPAAGVVPARVSIEADVRSLPPALRTQLSAAVSRGPDSRVRLETVVQKDGELRVESVSDVSPATPVSVSNVAASEEIPAEVPVVSVAADSPAVETNPGTAILDVEPEAAPARANIAVPVSVAEAARALGASPDLVQVPAAADGPERREIRLSLPDGTPSRVEADAVPGDGSIVALRIELPMNALAPSVEADVEARLSDYRAELSMPETPVATFEMAPGEPSAPFQLTGIDVASPEGKRVELLSQPLAPMPGGAPAPRVAAALPSIPVDSAADAIVGARPSPVVPTRTTSGLVPSLVRVARAVAGAEPAGVSIPSLTGPAVARFQGADGDEERRTFLWSPAARDGAFEFVSEGRGIDFADEIREKIYAALQEAVKAGDAWAARALKGEEPLLVVFEVDGQAEDAEIQVAGVSPVPEQAASLQAQAMGLSPDDYVDVKIGDRRIMALLPGRSAMLKVGDKRMKLVSPDGNVNIFVKSGRDWSRETALLLLSRKSLVANRNALSVLARGGSVAVREALSLPDDGQPFLVRLGHEGAGIVIRRAEKTEERP